MEKKLIDFAEVKFALTDSGSEAKSASFSGYGAVFGNIDQYGDVIVKGAFADSLKENSSPLMFLNHGLATLPIGRWTSLEEDDYGLKVEGEFLDTTTGRDAYIAAKAGALSGLSIGYRPLLASKGVVDGRNVRLLKTIRLAEISVVTFPVNELARIDSVKSMDDLDEFARKLVLSGMSIEEAKSFLSAHADECRAKHQDALSLSAAKDLLANLRL